MSFKIVLFLFLIYAFVNQSSCQTPATTASTTASTTVSTTPYNIACHSAYSTPRLNGICMPSSVCLGAPLTDICGNNNYVCCIPDPALSSGAGENSFVTLNRYLKFLGDTVRNRRLYYLFKKSVDDARITTCHGTAAYFAQMIGETNKLEFFEESKSPRAVSLDFANSIGNNATGDGEKYRGRGALLMRGRGVYLNATRTIPITNYDLLFAPEAAAMPTVAFRISTWLWTQNSYLITENGAAKKGNLNSIADGTFHNFTLITHAFTDNIQHLKQRAQYYEDIVKELNCKGIKRGRGVQCEMKGSSNPFGYAVPVCLIDFKKSYCGCEGQFTIESCPYGYNNAGQCRNPSIVKCCYEKCDSALDMVVIMDSSGSIGATDYKKGLDFIKKIVEDLEVGENDTRVSLINYSSTASIITNLQSEYNKTRLLQIIAGMRYEAGNTNTQDALRLANDVVLQERNGMRPLEKGVSKVVIVLTDGGSNVQAQLTIPNANKIKDRGFSVISVGIGSGINQAELIGMASNKDDVYNADNYDKIFEIVEGLLKTACEQPAKAIVETAIEGKVSQNSYKYFKLSFDNQTIDLFNATDDTFGFSIGVVNKLGRSNLFVSFDEENPKDPSDFLQSSNSDSNLNGSYIEQRRVLKTGDNEIETPEINYPQTIYQVTKPGDKNVLFMSIKGAEEINEFEIFIYNRVIPTMSGQNSILNANICFNLAILLAITIFLNFIH